MVLEEGFWFLPPGVDPTLPRPPGATQLFTPRSFVGGCKLQQTTTKGDTMLTVIDLFAGAGGFSLGFEQAGMDVIYAVEQDQTAAATFRRNFMATVYAGDIRKIEGYPSANVVIGGPPCQGFSPLGRDRDDASRSELNELFRYFLKAVEEIDPDVFIIENVPQFHKSEQFTQLLDILDDYQFFRSYFYQFGTLDAADYGVPQHRRRGFLIAAKTSFTWPPPVTHHSGNYVTVREAIGDLPRYPIWDDIHVRAGRQELHVTKASTMKSIERYAAVPIGGNRHDLPDDLLPDCWIDKKGTGDVMGRLWWDQPSVTIRTEFTKPEKGRYLHPVADRPITHREAARLQTFPDTFVFEGTKTDIARQIGNAVPPKLAYELAQFIQALVAN